MQNNVYLIKCNNYEQAEEKINALLEMMGGMKQFVQPHERIVLKTNLLRASEPEKAITTHPAVVAAVAASAKNAGAEVVIADSPGSGYQYNNKTLDKLYRASGMDQAAEAAGVELNRDTTYSTVPFPEGHLIKRFEIITPIVEADAVFNLCKLKTHTFMNMTGAVKNNFGVIPGLSKPGYHATLHDRERFADMLLDLAMYVAPRVSIMDAVMGMEGEGPNAGTPRKIGWLLAATNQLALDVVAGEIIGLSRTQNPVLRAAEKRGLLPTHIEEITIIGADLAEICIPDFRLPSTLTDDTGFSRLPWWQKVLIPLIKNGVSVVPQISRSACVACGVCRDACPVGAISLLGNGRKYAQIDSKKCIHCYCCHEMCPHDAINLHQSWMYRLINRV